MRIRICLPILVLGTSLLLMLPGRLFAQKTAAPRDEIVLPEEFTRILKEEWTFVKDETDAFLKATAKKSEFETAPEFEGRVAREKQTYLSKINNHIADKKFDRRVFAVLIKANLASYDAATQTYSVTPAVTVEAPYNTPTITCVVPKNDYVALADSIRRGYRFSKLYLKFNPALKWKISRDEARAAKKDEENVFFKVRCTIDLSQADLKKGATIRIIPRDISLVNRQTQVALWAGAQIR